MGCPMDTSRFTSEAGNRLIEAIDNSGGHEVLAIGRLSNTQLVEEIAVAARGNHTAVPALSHFMEKGDVVIHNHPSGNLEPSAADLRVASDLGQKGIGFYIVDNGVTQTYVVAEPVEKREIDPIDIEELVSHLLPGGSLQKKAAFFEPRDSQIEMLEAVTERFNQSGILVVEAGTGVGKSLAYLLPACRWVQKNKERVVVSTATINLQQQLIEKDIPLVCSMLGKDIKPALVKGRRNYLCLRRLGEALDENVLFRESDSELSTLAEWAKETASGSRSDISPPPTESVWGKICSEADTCTGLRCIHRNDCFVLKARREAASANILVVNHHLLFSDISIRSAGAGYDITAVLPPYSRVVFDEAHNIEKSATSFFSSSLTRFSVGRALNMVFRERKQRRMGLCISLSRIMGNIPDLEAIPSIVGKAQEASIGLDAVARHSLDGKTYRFRINEQPASEMEQELLNRMEGVRREIADLTHRLHSVIERFHDEDEPDEIISARLAIRRLEAIAMFCGSFQSYRENPDNVYWAEKNKTSTGELYVEFHITPLQVADVLQESVYSRFPTVVCTSATITVGGTFTYWLRNAGLERFDGAEVTALSLPSPFPYGEKVMVAVPTDAPEPNQAEYQPYLSALIRDALCISEGKGLILFTSYHMLSETYNSISEELSGAGIRSLIQGSEDRARLLSEFSSDTNSALFATDSFWEGVDTPGDALRVVCICRLPFRVPNDPVLEAKHENIIQRGGNAFLELSLPDAVTRLKQGFGRLMRRSTDSGVVIITDPRIIKKWYGEAFLESLPQTRRSFKPTSSLLKDVERFLYP